MTEFGLVLPTGAGERVSLRTVNSIVELVLDHQRRLAAKESHVTAD